MGALLCACRHGLCGPDCAAGLGASGLFHSASGFRASSTPRGLLCSFPLLTWGWTQLLVGQLLMLLLPGVTPTPVERLSGSGAADKLEVSEEASHLPGVQMAPRVVASCLWPQSLLFPPGAEGSDQGSKRGSDRGSKLWLSSGHWRGPSPCSGLRGEPPGGLVDGVGELASGSAVSHGRLLGEGVQPGGKALRGTPPSRASPLP